MAWPMAAIISAAFSMVVQTGVVDGGWARGHLGGTVERYGKGCGGGHKGSQKNSAWALKPNATPRGFNSGKVTGELGGSGESGRGQWRIRERSVERIKNPNKGEWALFIESPRARGAPAALQAGPGSAAAQANCRVRELAQIRKKPGHMRYHSTQQDKIKATEVTAGESQPSRESWFGECVSPCCNRGADQQPGNEITSSKRVGNACVQLPKQQQGLQNVTPVLCLIEKI